MQVPLPVQAKLHFSSFSLGDILALLSQMAETFFSHFILIMHATSGI